MRHLCSFLRLLIVTAVLGLATLGGAKPAHAAVEFRYGQLSWRKVAPLTAEFIVTCGFKRSNYPGRYRDGFVGIGDKLTDAPTGIVLNFDNDATTTTPIAPVLPPAGGISGNGLDFVVVAIDPTRDLAIARAMDPNTGQDRIRFTYPSQVDQTDPDPGTPWVASIGLNFNGAAGASGRRPSGPLVRNNADGQFRLETTVDLSANGQSAATSMPTLFTVPQTGGSFFVPGYDADQNTIRYRLATFTEAGGVFFQPLGATIDPVTGEYTVPAGLAPGYWSTQVVIEEYNGAGLLVGKSPVDFMFEVRANLSGSAPVFKTPPTPAAGSVITAVVGRPISFLVQASDPDGEAVTINATGVPSGARQVASLPTTANLVQSQLSWTPTQANLGAHSIVYTAADQSGNVTQNAIIILVIDGIDLLEPDGGEMYTVNQVVDIRWDSGGGTRQAGVKIEISRDGGATWDPTPITALASDTGIFSWTVTGPFSKTCRIRVSNAADPADYGISASDFTIADGRRVGPVCSPAGATNIPDNEPSWTEVPLSFPDDLIIRTLEVKVDISHPFIGDLEVGLVHPDGTVVLLHDETGEGKADLTETYGYGFRGGVQLTAPVESLTTLYGKRSIGTWKLRVRDLNPGDVGQVNQWCLTMVGRDTGKITVTSPAPGDRWAVATTHPITWTATGVVGDVNVQISRDSGATWTTVGTLPVSAGSFDWLVSGPETTHARVRIVSVEDPVQVDDTDGDFTIQNPYFTILLPAAGDSIPVGRPYQIRWDGVPLGGGEDVKIEFSKNGTDWITLAGAASNTGIFTWTPTKAHVSDTARIRITANQAPARIAQTGEFKVLDPTIAILAPVGGEKWFIETTQTIRWSTVGVSGPVNVEVSRDGGHVWELIGVNLTSAGSEGSFNWKVTGPVSDQSQHRAQVRITAVNDPTKFGLSLPFTISEMHLKVLSPNGGEVFGIGTTQTIQWDPGDVIGNVDISLSTDGGDSFTPLFTDVPNGGRIDWTVGNTANNPETEVLIRVKAHDYLAADESDAVFTLLQPTLTVVSPAGGEELRVGKSALLKWTSEGVPGRVRIDLSRNGGGTWETLFASAANNGSVEWKPVTGPDTSNAILRITSEDNPSVSAQSAAAFNIVTPSITVTSPNGGQQWFTGSAQAITWNAKGFDGPVKIELTRNGGQRWETLFERTENDGVQEWVVSGDNSTNARIKITALNEESLSDQSDGPFSITAPMISLGAPNGGQTWLVGTTQTVTWRAVGVTGPVDIELSLDGGVTWAPLTKDTVNTANDGAEAWLVSGAVSTNARIRVSWHDRPEVNDSSDKSFTIAVPTFQVTSPTSTSTWHMGSRETITWSGPAVTAGGTVDILLSRNNGKTYETIIADTANDGSATWQVVGKTAGKCKVKVVWKSQEGVSATSNGTFKIAGKLKVKKKK